MDYPINEGRVQIIPASNTTTTSPDGAVKLRFLGSVDSEILPESVPNLLARIATLYPDQPALGYRRYPDENVFHFITYRKYLDVVRKVAKGFIKLGLERYHSVAIIGFNSPEWMISYLAAIHAGGFATGIYTTNSPESCFYCIEKSQANIVVAGDETFVGKIWKYRKDLPNLKKIIQWDGTPIADDVLSWDDLLDIGNAQSDIVLDNVLKKIAVNQCAAILYTSGTVSNPKPAMLSHDNLIFQGKILGDAIGIGFGESTVSYLPLNHLAGQILDMFMLIPKAGTTFFVGKDPLREGLNKAVLEVRPTFFYGFPRIWEKMAEKLLEIHIKSGPIAPKAAKQILGFDRCKNFYIGSASSSVHLKKYFNSLDIPIMELYGMTECGPQTLNLSTAFCFESVGKTISGLMTKIQAPEENNCGEICMNGRNVFMGYLNDREKTDEAIDMEGWLHSGDLGRIDNKGFLHLMGRKKEILITSGGENIPLALIEANIKKELPVLSNVVLIGDKRKYLTVLVTLSCTLNRETGIADQLTEFSKKWLESLGCPFKTMEEVIASGPDEKIIKAIQSGIDAANLKAISKAQKVQKFALLPHDFSETTGEIVPTVDLGSEVRF